MKHRAITLLSAVMLPGLALAELVPSPALAPDIMALPRLAGTGETVVQINDQLALLDQRDLDAVMCYGAATAEDPFRTVEVLSDGPEFLSILIATSSYCEGAARPWWSQRIVTFDLETGSETDLRDQMPFSPDGQEAGLQVLFLTAIPDMPGECLLAYTSAIRDGVLAFDLGLSTSQGALVIWPRGLADIEEPCLDLAFVPVERLREAGFHPRLIKALDPPG